jgi:Asp/Glu/hydantoin racemase
MPRLAILHTAAFLVDVFKPLVAQAYPGLDTYHVVDESLLQDLIRHGTSEGLNRRVATHAILARDAGASVILFTCSSTSPAVEIARRLVDIPILKIDDPMAERAVGLGRRIGLVCTTASTKAPSEALLLDHAAAKGRSIEVIPVLRSDAYEARLAGDQTAHDRIVVEAALDLAAQCDVIVLAQASLAHLGPVLQTRTGVPILTSPALCVEALAPWLLRSDQPRPTTPC